VVDAQAAQIQQPSLSASALRRLESADCVALFDLLTELLSPKDAKMCATKRWTHSPFSKLNARSLAAAAQIRAVKTFGPKSPQSHD